ncbi:MAG: ABC transporter permease [Gemmatimonadota bacterium]|nr:ABC transporter permease [Gemmatimonadota bacterium]
MIRSFRRAPGFVAIATVSMGIALGISTSVFAMMDALTHPDPPFRDVDQLYTVSFSVRVADPPPASVLNDGVLGLDGVERVAGWQPQGNGVAVMFGGYVRPTLVGMVSPGYFGLLGTTPRLGRLFSEADHASEDVAVVSDKVWRRDFSSRAAIGDATVRVDDRVYRIVGVLRPGTDRSLTPDVYVAAPNRPAGWPWLLVRLKPGVTVAEFQPRLKEMNERLSKLYSRAPKDRGIGAYIRSLRPDPLAVRDFHRAMVGAAACILLIACANVAALMLARGLARKRDYALRLALGARPLEIGREVIIEVGILALLGCVAGVLVTSWFVGLIGGAMPPEMEWQGFLQPQWSWRVLALSAGAVIVSVGVAGGFPAWMAARTDPAGPLKEGSGSTTGRAGTRFRWLVIAELAIAMTLLMSTSLMQKSIRLMERYDFGYPVEQLAIAGVGAPWRQDSTSLEEMARRQQQALDFIRATPGVAAAEIYARQSCGVLQNVIVTDRTAEGGPSLAMGSNARGTGGCAAVGPRFFRLAGIDVVAGRDFEAGDLTGAGAAILDQNTASRLFPGESPLGHKLKLGGWRSTADWYTVVGVVRNHRLGFDQHPELGADTTATIYLVSGFQQAISARPDRRPRGSLSMAFLVRMSGNPDSTTLAVTRALQPLVPGGGRAAVVKWNSGYYEMLRTEDFLALVFTCLGLASLLLGAAGLYSVVSYVTGQRMREFAVRVALGATTRNVSRLVLREAFLMAIGGTAVGAGFGMWAAFLLWDRMWGIYPVDAEALVVAEAVLVVTTMVACLVPALRAAKADPLEVMRAY